MNFDIKDSSDSKDVRLWIPYPVSDEHQTISDVKISGDYSKSGIFHIENSTTSALYAEWTRPGASRLLLFSFKVTRKEAVNRRFPSCDGIVNNKKFGGYLKETSYAPVTGTVKTTAEEIVQDKKTILARARALYDYIVDNWVRDPGVLGCGPGDVLTLLDTKKGKCVDIHSVFVAFARSLGIPAREVFGIRIPKGESGEMTKAQHCWAEFYLPGSGWVPVDPSDVLKIVLEKKIKKIDAAEFREYYFGAVDENRIAYGTGRDLTLTPKPKADKLHHFMYPYAEIEGIPVECLAPEDFKYTITYRDS